MTWCAFTLMIGGTINTNLLNSTLSELRLRSKDSRVATTVYEGTYSAIGVIEPQWMWSVLSELDAAKVQYRMDMELHPLFKSLSLGPLATLFRTARVVIANTVEENFFGLNFKQAVEYVKAKREHDHRQANNLITTNFEADYILEHERLEFLTINDQPIVLINDVAALVHGMNSEAKTEVLDFFVSTVNATKRKPKNFSVE